MPQVILSSTYFGPVQWYQKLNRHDISLIERYDHFVKQTYRNRCVIASANGPLPLTVPIERTEGTSASRSLMKDIRISNHGNWRHIHWQALVSAYGESPFFEYYADDLCPFFERHWEFLFDFNLEITQTLCSLLDVRTSLVLTDEYKKREELARQIPSVPTQTSSMMRREGEGMPCEDKLSEQSDNDFRDAIIPKNPPPDPSFELKPYYQVYRHKFGFLPNLSVLDLLFNEGNEAILYL